MKISIKNNVGIEGVNLLQISRNIIMLIIATKEKYPEFMCGKSYNGSNCTALLVTIYESGNKPCIVSVIPETDGERDFIDNCEHYLGSQRYGPEIIYIRHREYDIIDQRNDCSQEGSHE